MMKQDFRNTIFNVLAILFVVVFPHFVPLPFYSYAIVCLGVVVLMLRKKNKTLRDLGLKQKGISFQTFAVGMVSAVIWVAFMRWVYLPVISYFFTVPDYTEYNFIQNHLSNLIITTIAAWVIGGFYEEIIFRGFIQKTIQNWFKSNHAFLFSGLITSVLFGLYHFQQGFLGVISATLSGLFWTFLLKRFGKNLWYPIISHAIFDTITLTLIYLGWFGK
ncbi:CPBP family intramembrane glutamic endopeptidase [Flavobacterium sp. N3904]|uniref:CPBP family intramembrane glutamic endopeptidase n=1 Tax=Flavobacterium sp. N3904 TaxID=2986835 RepID=UPI0022240951|nr:type II CAAX endopeptidase family protein [Flavobacterium sp. N3904]